MFDCGVEERWRLTEESEHTWCLSCMMNDREVHARSYACSLLSLSAIRTLSLSRSHPPSISLSFSVDLSHGDIYLLLCVFSFLSTHTTCLWCLRFFALCLKRGRQGGDGFLKVWQKRVSTHGGFLAWVPCWELCVLTLYLSATHQAHLSCFRCYMFEPLKFLWHRSISCSIILI